MIAITIGTITSMSGMNAVIETSIAADRDCGKQTTPSRLRGSLTA